MDWNLFWTAFGAIGGTLGAIATFIAVIVALWQTKINLKKELKVTFSDDFTIVPGNINVFLHYVGLTITNVGNREVVINNWGYKCNDGSKMLILPDDTPIGRSLQIKLPHKLNIEESITLYYSVNLFYNALTENIKDEKISLEQKLKFFATDSTSKIYEVTTKKTVKETLDALEVKMKKSSR